MDKTQFNELMARKPSDFYIWLWRCKSKHLITKAQEDYLTAKYEEINHIDDTPLEFTFKDMPSDVGQYEIREPIWKTRSVGLNAERLRTINEINITYKDKEGKRLYPDTYTITKEKALTFEQKKIKGHNLVIVPISELTLLDNSN